MYNIPGLGFIEGFLLGGLIGAGAALLLAPVSGRVIRKQIRSESDGLQHRIQGIGDSGMSRTAQAAEQGESHADEYDKRNNR